MVKSVNTTDLKSVGHCDLGGSSPPTRIFVKYIRELRPISMGKFRYTISRKHVFVDNEPVLMYYVENMPFAFDVLEKHEKEDKWVLSEAAINESYTLEDILRFSDYLMAEECHPVLFDLDLINPEVLPDEHVS